jgi:hypothetical protein
LRRRGHAVLRIAHRGRQRETELREHVSGIDRVDRVARCSGTRPSKWPFSCQPGLVAEACVIFAAKATPEVRVEPVFEGIADSTASAPFVMLPADRERARADRSVEGGD